VRKINIITRISLCAFRQENIRQSATNHICGTLPTRRRKDSDNENDRQNGLRMNNEMTVKEKGFSFLPTRK
jgi:hypothetical protein